MRIRGVVITALVVVGTTGAMTAAEPFRLAIANSFALLNANPGANAPNSKAMVKKAFMAVRAEGCADSSTVRVTATAEGLRDGVRRSEPLSIVPASPPGAFAVSPPPQGGQWVIAFVATCGKATAAALVPTTASGFDRDRSTFLDHAPTKAEVDKAVSAVKP